MPGAHTTIGNIFTTLMVVQSAGISAGQALRIQDANGNRWTSWAPDSTIAGNTLTPTFNILTNNVTINSTAADPTTFTTLVLNQFRQVTLTGTNANQVVTDAATVVIIGPPIASTNVVFTRAFALWVDSGISRFDGDVLVGVTSTTNVTGTAGVFAGGIAFTDVLNAWIDDATHGDGTTTLYIGNNTIDKTAPSDERLKEEFRPYEGSVMAAIRSLEFQTFQYRPTGLRERFGRTFGLTAQNVQSVLPEYVAERTDGYLQVEFNRMMPLALRGLQEHEMRFATVEERMAALEAANSILRRQLVGAGLIPQE